VPASGLARLESQAAHERTLAPVQHFFKHRSQTLRQAPVLANRQVA
jgi:hypothetical protein